MTNANEKARYNAAAESVKAAKEDRERAMFGTTAAHVKRDYEQAPGSKGLYIMGVLSDVQEANSMCDFERARQFANKAKFLMSEYLPKDTDGRML